MSGTGRHSVRRSGVIGVIALSALAMPSSGEIRDAPPTRLEVVDDGGRVVLQLPVTAGERLDVSFVHSSERCKWSQHYRVTRHGLVQVSSTFAAFGAGMPVASSDGSPIRRTSRGFVASTPRWLGDIPMMYSAEAAMRLGHRGRTVPLDGMFDDFDQFRLRVR